MTKEIARRAASATLALGLCALAGAANAQDPVRIGVIFPTQNQVRWAWEERLLVEQAKANGDEVIVQFSNESAATQKNQVESMIQRGVEVRSSRPSTRRQQVNSSKRRRPKE